MAIGTRSRVRRIFMERPRKTPHMAHTVEIRGDVTEEYGELTIVAADPKYAASPDAR